jgi:hypothetical protein
MHYMHDIMQPAGVPYFGNLVRRYGMYTRILYLALEKNGGPDWQITQRTVSRGSEYCLSGLVNVANISHYCGAVSAVWVGRKAPDEGEEDRGQLWWLCI